MIRAVEMAVRIFFAVFQTVMKCGEFPTEVWEAYHLQAPVILLSYSQSKGQAHRTKRKHLAAVTGTIKNIVSPILEQAKDTIAELHRTANYLLAVEVCGWDYSCCLWNRAFCVSWPCQMVQCLISILLRYLSLPESGGKDKTMMMNMMTGAVAINGGVGVMEVRQPQMAGEVAQAVEQIAADIVENAHITLHELKGKIDAVVEKKLPSFKALMEMKPVAVAQTTVKDASLTVYQNGYAVYEMDGAHTVMAVDRCGDYRYDFTDGTYQVVPAETFEDTEWSVRLLMEGERRMEHNLNNRVADAENVSLECDGSDWSTAVMVDFLDEDNADLLADQELRRLYAAMSKLTERQSEVLQLYFYKGMNQEEIGEELGIGQRAVSYSLTGALKKIRKIF